MASYRPERAAAFDTAARAEYRRAHVDGLTAWERHQAYVRDYVQHYASAAAPPQAPAAAATASDADALAAAHRFIRTPADDAAGHWGARLARRYYERLFKEYAIADLSRYKESKVGLRWRTQAEVVRCPLLLLPHCSLHLEGQRR
jgi:hypothetical protein